MNTEFDIAIIGGGIVGLAQGWMAARHGQKVGIFERSSGAQDATVRNFGMIWPVGQPAGEMYNIALNSRQLWLEIAAQSNLNIEECGSIHLAHHEDERQVLREFIDQSTHSTEWISPTEVCSRSALANPNGLLGGMYSPTELRVNPRTAAEHIRNWLASDCGVQMHFDTPITSVNGNELRSSNGESWTASKIIICSGSDLCTLFPDNFAASRLVLCKLQMLKSVSQPDYSPAPVPHIASGLTLRHYESFASCPSLEAVKTRVKQESPILDEYGIHVMASQFPNGEVILGDSHEYGDNITPFDKSEIDDLMLRELEKVIRLQDWTIKEKWHGIYAKHPELPIYEEEIDEIVSLFVGTGGAGMTLSFGLADRYWKKMKGE